MHSGNFFLRIFLGANSSEEGKNETSKNVARDKSLANQTLEFFSVLFLRSHVN